jgi:hypothetical protein
MGLPPPSEAEVLCQVLQYLTMKRIAHWRQNVGTARALNRDGTTRFVRFGIPGCSDVLAILPPRGRLAAIELKKKGQGPTPEQIAFLGHVKAAGGLALVIRSVEELIAGLAAAQRAGAG